MVSGILIRVGIGVVAATVLAAIVGLFLPSTFEVEKSLVIRATPEQIHTFTGDLTRWPEWVAWLRDDPDLEVTYGDLTAGVGASQTWTSESSDGHLTFTRCDPDWGVSYELVFSKNTYTSVRSIMYRAVPDGTEVVWHMSGDNGSNLMARYFVGLMPSLLGPQFEEGLARLKLLVEKSRIEGELVPEG
jgi:hypothetical protein